MHPTLAKVLAPWKLAGWERMLGRAPGLDDLLTPSRVGRNRTTNHMLHKFYEDLDSFKGVTREQLLLRLQAQLRSLTAQECERLLYD